MTSQPGKQTIAIHVLPNIWRNSANQAIQFGQLREYNMQNIFLENPYTKCGGETSPRPFTEHISGSRVWSFIQFVLLHLQVDDYHNVLKLSC